MRQPLPFQTLLRTVELEREMGAATPFVVADGCKRVSGETRDFDNKAFSFNKLVGDFNTLRPIVAYKQANLGTNKTTRPAV